MNRRLYVTLSLVIGLAAIALVACSESPEPTATNVAFNPTPAGGEPTPAGPTATPGNVEPTATSAPLVGDATHGQQLAANNGCTGCHSTGTNRIVGPGWGGLYAQAGSIVPGLSADEYLHQSIVDPNAYVVEGFQANLMPKTFGDTLSDQDIADIIAYIKSLS